MRRAILFSLAAILAALVPAGAQTLPFVISVQQGSSYPQIITEGGTLAMPAAAIGAPVNGQIGIQYINVGTSVSANITQIALSGSTDFTISNLPDFSTGPVVMSAANPLLNLSVRYLPSNSKGASAKATFTYLTDTGRSGMFVVNLTGTAPEFAYTYQVQPSGNTGLLAPGSTVQLPQTALNATASVLITLTNRGTGAGAVNNVSLKAAQQFALAGVPFLPASVDAGKSLQFSVQFTPSELPAASGEVQVDLLGSSFLFAVSGSGKGASYQYALVSQGGAAPIAPGAAIALPDATVGGDKTTVTVRVSNVGNDNGVITAASLAVSGTAFSLIETPFLPYTVQPNGSFTLKVQFSPAQPGKAAGRLLIGSDNFDLTGTGLGPSLTYSYAAAGAATSVLSGGTVVLPATAVGNTSTVLFTINNSGTAAQPVKFIGPSGAGSVFTVSGVPALPGSVDPGQSLSFTVTFAPVALGTSTGSLMVDTQSFTLSGVGNPPAALPSYSFSGASGAVEPQQQPAIGLSLASAYNLALNGTLTLKFTSDVFADDPSVQFSAGGRTVNFTIPAGSTQAVFANGATQMRLQSGTVAGTVTVTPSFATAGGIDLTPTAPTAQVLSVAQSAPKLTSVVLSSKSGATVTLLVTGYATGRNITQMDFQFTAVSGENLGTTKVSVPVESTFNAWYQGSTSAAYGSQFTATVPFTMAGDITNSKSITALVDTLQAVSVTLANRQGASSAVSVNLK